jgi:hypothetical protein
MQNNEMFIRVLNEMIRKTGKPVDCFGELEWAQTMALLPPELQSITIEDLRKEAVRLRMRNLLYKVSRP